MRIGINQLTALEVASNGRATMTAIADEIVDRVGDARATGVARTVYTGLVRAGLLTYAGNLTYAGYEALNAAHRRGAGV